MSRHRADLLGRAARGDDEALAALVSAYHDRVYRFGVRVCRDGFDADDAVQEAFIKLSRRPDVVGDGGALSWLMTVVRNACLRMMRPFAQRVRLETREAEHDQVPDDLPSPEEALDRWRLVRSVHAAIAALDADSREVLILRDLEGLSGAETCEALELTPAAMKTRLHRAREKLRHVLLVALKDAPAAPGDVHPELH